MEIRNNLKKYRVWKGITQKNLSEKLKISNNTIQKIENHNYFPNYKIRSKICKYFDVKPDQMFIPSYEKNKR